MPPRSAQPGGHQACSIQQTAPDSAAAESHTPTQGCPSHVPIASTRPWAGGYMDM